jgi:archaemetzincin
VAVLLWTLRARSRIAPWCLLAAHVLWVVSATACIKSDAPAPPGPPSSSQSDCLGEVVELDVVLRPPWTSHWKRLNRSDCRPDSWLVRSPERGQSLGQYRSASSVRPAPGNLRVGVLSSLSAAEQSLMPLVAEFSGLFFQRNSKVVETIDVPKAALETRRGDGRGQLDARVLLAGLPDDCTRDGGACLWLTGEDLYISGLQYVFGLAQYQRRQGVVSLHRTLRAPAKEGLAQGALSSRIDSLRRLLKVAVHELGHPFSLQHCVHFRHCLMAGTSSVRENDEGRLALCPLDHEKLRQRLGFEPTRRFLELADFADREGLHPEARYWRQMAGE